MVSKIQHTHRSRALVVLTVVATILVTATLTLALTAGAQPRAHASLNASHLGVISHRGAAAIAPENTLASVRAGIEQDADFIEIDVRLTLDRVPILMHDARLDRTTNGTGKVKYLRYTDITGLDAGSWFGAEFRGEKVPTFDEFLTEFVPGRALAFIELKGTWPEAEIDELLAKLHAEEVIDRVVIQSFNTDVMRHVSEQTPDAARVLLTRKLDAETVQFIQETGVHGLGARLTLIEEHLDIVRELQEAGVGCFAYTLNNELAWEAAELAGVDLIVTDNAAELQHWLNR